MTRFYSLTPGVDDLTGIPADYNAFQFDPTTLQSTDTVTGGSTGGFIDLLLVTASGTILGSQFSGVSNIEQLNLSGGGNNVTLTDGFVGGTSIGYFAVVDGGGSDVIDASGINTTIVFFATGGADTFKGGHGNDAISIAEANLTSADSFQGGAGVDNLYFSSAGTEAASAFTNVSGIEGLVLANGTNDVTLTNGLVASTSIGYFAVAGSTGDDTVDASGVGNGMPIAFIGTGGGNDTFIGGSGNDSFLFAANQLTAADTVVGGTGSDTLWITSAGTIDTAALLHVSGIEGVFLQVGGTFNLADGITAAASFAAVGSPSVDTFDASAVTAYDVIFVGNGGADVLKGGSQNDTFFVADSGFATIDGNSGIDRIELTNGSSSFNLSSNAAKIHSVEVISMENVEHGNVTLTGADIAPVSGNNALYLVGDPGDSYTAGTGYTQIASGIFNAAVEPGHSFFEFQHSNGSILYVDSFIFDTQTNDPIVDLEPENSPTSRIVYTDSTTFPAGTTVTHTLGGADAALFNIDPVTGSVTFKSSPDFETPQDQDHNNHYEFTVTTINDAAIPSTTKFVTSIVTDVSGATVFMSGLTATVSANVATATTVANNTAGHTLPSVVDNDHFNINATTGAATFKASPDNEAPMDVNHGNEYDITVLPSDGLHSHDATLHIATAVGDWLL